MDSDTIEKLLIKCALLDKNYAALVTGAFQKEYFDNQEAGEIFHVISGHFREYGNIIPRDVIYNEIDKDNKVIESEEDVKNFFGEVDAVDFDMVKNYTYLINKTNEYLKDKAIRKAVMDAVGIISSKGQINEIRSLVETALCKDLNINLGLDYFGTVKERISRIMRTSLPRLPSYFPQFDEYINGGFPPYTLSVITAKIHSWKSAFIANISARQALNGHNVILFTLEMSEDAYAQRYDSIYSKIDINKMYLNKDITLKVAKEILSMKEKGVGSLYIKQYPTGKGTVIDFTSHMRELIMRGIQPEIVYADYINLMKPSYKSKADMYSDVKGIAEELRSLSFEFKIPVISVSQLNREGAQISFDEVDFTYISESIGVPATADFMAIFGHDEEKAIYESEIQYKIVKNRLGGRVGEISKFYYDARTLKMYDSLELDIWIDDAAITGDERNTIKIPDTPVRYMGERSKGRKKAR